MAYLVRSMGRVGLSTSDASEEDDEDVEEGVKY